MNLRHWTSHFPGFNRPEIAPGPVEGPIAVVVLLGAAFLLVAWNPETGDAWYELDPDHDKSLEFFDALPRIAQAA